MGRTTYIIALCFLALFLSGCDQNTDPTPDVALVNFRIDVFTADTWGAQTRSEISYAATEDEKMHTLRIIVVRPDNTVEDNRFFDLSSGLERYEAPRFEVVGREWKRVYLFANERTEVPVAGTDPVVSRKLVDYDLESIAPGHQFPTEALSNLEMHLDGNTDEVLGAIPMSECHRVWVPNKDHSCTLWITRAAVKFTFRFTNRSSVNYTLKGLTIDKLAHREYFMPRNAVYTNRVASDGTAYREITSFDVPLLGNNGYYTYGSLEGLDVSLPAGGEAKEIGPIYLLEGKYTDAADARNYSMSIVLDGVKLSSYFPQLSQLPRNTHVVVSVEVNDVEVNWQVELVPYTEKKLEPVFGLD